MKRWLREPLLHFLLLGAALFAWYEWRGGGGGPGSTRIVVGSGQIDHLVAGFTRTWQRPPSEAELKGLLDDWVREEIASREAMAMGLDRDDTVIRRRLRQKLEFLLEDAAAAAPPTDAELRAWFESHAADYALAPEMALRQVFVNVEKRGAAAPSEAQRLLAELERRGGSSPIDTLGDASMLPQEIDLSLPGSDRRHLRRRVRRGSRESRGRALGRAAAVRFRVASGLRARAPGGAPSGARGGPRPGRARRRQRCAQGAARQPVRVTARRSTPW